MNQYRHLIKKYFNEHSLVESNIESFNRFMERGIQEIINETQDIIPTIIPAEVKDFKIKLGKVTIEKPQIVEADGSKRDIYPMEARLRKLTYSAPIYLNISAYIDGVEREQFTALIGKIPVMVKSKFCHLNGLNKENLISHNEDPDDLGGYFILNGNERVLVIVEDLVSNRLFIEKNSTGPSKYTAQVYSERSAYRIPHSIEQMKDGVIYISFTRFKRVPIISIIKALGLVKDQDISDTISEDKQYDDIFINLYETLDLKTQNQALDFLSKKIGLTQINDEKTEEVTDLLDKYLLPHLGITAQDRMNKAYNLCKYIKKFLLVARDKLSIFEKDHYMNKRLKLSGDLLGDLFRVNLRALVQDILYNFQRLVKRGKFQSIRIIIRDQLLTSRIKSAMATGTWVGGRKGVSQNIDRTNFMATTSHLQRVVSLLSTSQENFDARSLHPTHWGRLCLDKNTNVLLSDKKTTRTLDQLQNCWKHHKVMTYDTKDKKFIPSSIVNYSSSNPELMNKKVFKITAESDREIIATQDHPFFTKKGWKDAGKLRKNELVAVYPMPDSVKTPNPPTIEDAETVVQEKEIKELFPKRFKHYIKELKNKELLPFTINNYWAEIIARLQGHLFTDGHCGKYNLEFYCGSLKDAEEIAGDIKTLGFEPSKINKKISKGIFNGRKITTTTYRFTKGGALHALLVALETPIGRKTNLSYEIPKWIRIAELSVKREFLSSYMGGDGGKPRFITADRKIGKVKIEDLFFHKNINNKDNGLKFANELKDLFEILDVKIKKINLEEGYLRKDGSKTIKIKLIFNKDNENIKKLITKIGFRYCNSKSEIALFLGEWLRLHNKTIKDKIGLKRQIRDLYKSGKKPKEISQILNVGYRNVNSCLFERKYEKTSIAKSNLPSFNDWLNDSRIKGTDLIWEKVVNLEEVNLDDVRDITTYENTHNFIANGFLTHNCPIETPEGTPIGLRKNLAMLTKISQEEMPDDKIKKMLEGTGLE